MKFLIDSKHGLGDCVQIIPMLQILKQNYPDSYLAVIVSGKVSEELLMMAPVKIDKFYYLNMQQATIKSFINFVFQIRKEHFDYFILSPITTKWKAKIFAMFTGAKNKIGEQYKSFDIYKRDNAFHMVERNVALLKSFCNVPDKIARPLLNAPVVKNLLISKEENEKIIGVCIGGGTASNYRNELVYPRAWSIERIKIITEILIKSNNKIILFGGKDELKDLKIFSNILNNNNILNFVGKTTITESAVLAKQCDLVIGVDTGMQHIADAVGTKTLSVFGPTNPKTHGAYSKNAKFVDIDQPCKYCYGTEKYLSCNDRKCLKDVSVDNVMSVFEKVWNDR